MLNIVIFGAPGSGKGTQSGLFVQKMGLVHLSTGNMLRDEMARRTALGEKIRKGMDAGEFVSDEQAAQLLVANMNRNKSAKGFVFDGFPRTLSQTEILDQILKERNTKLDFAFLLDLPADIAFERIMKRAVELNRGEDQNPETVRKRFTIYQEKTKPVIDFYLKQGKLKIIDGMGTPDDIFEKITKEIKLVLDF
ncbi:MAG: adenylate kinase [Bacteroidales bacterium]|nr:adenylate kinase [Bacteroidales bacterium]